MNIQEKVEKQKKEIRILATHGYTIIDLEDNIITKWNIDQEKTHNIYYNRVSNKWNVRKKNHYDI